MSDAKGWQLRLSELGAIWQGGCIIRAKVLRQVQAAYSKDPELSNLLLDSEVAAEMTRRSAGWRRFVVMAMQHGIPVPAHHRRRYSPPRCPRRRPCPRMSMHSSPCVCVCVCVCVHASPCGRCLHSPRPSATSTRSARLCSAPRSASRRRETALAAMASSASTKRATLVQRGQSFSRKCLRVFSSKCLCVKRVIVVGVIPLRLLLKFLLPPMEPL